MTSVEGIKSTIRELGNLSGKSRELTELATKIKKSQERLRLSVEAAVRVLSSLRAGNSDIRSIMDVALGEKSNQDQAVQAVLDILNSAPDDAEVDSAISGLKSAIEASDFNTATLPAEQQAALNNTSPDRGQPPSAGPPPAQQVPPPAQQGPPPAQQDGNDDDDGDVNYMGGYTWRGNSNSKSKSKKKTPTKRKGTRRRTARNGGRKTKKKKK